MNGVNPRAIASWAEASTQGLLPTVLPGRVLPELLESETGFACLVIVGDIEATSCVGEEDPGTQCL